MIIVLGSAMTFIATFLVFVKSKKCKHFLKEITYSMIYNILAVKEICFDYLLILYNNTDLPKKTGKVAIVTGGSRGIGADVVKMLLQCDMEVVIACRRPSAGDKCVKEIRKSGITTGRVKILELDNSSLKSITKFVVEIKKYYTHVDVLINNAGIMFTPYSETEDGFEQQWQVNYLSHFLLTSLLMPLFKAAGTSKEYARIVNVSSCAHLLGRINFYDINYKNDFISSAAYAQSKLAQTMFTKSLQDEFKTRDLYISTISVHPGVVNTDLFNTTWLRHFKWFLNIFFKTPAQGATTVVYAAINKSIKNNSTLYINNCIESSVNPLVYNSNLRARLFQLSMKHTQIKDFFEPS